MTREFLNTLIYIYTHTHTHSTHTKPKQLLPPTPPIPKFNKDMEVEINE